MISEFNSTSAIDEPRALAASLIESLNSSTDVLAIYKLKELLDHGHEQRNRILKELHESCHGIHCISSSRSII